MEAGNIMCKACFIGEQDVEWLHIFEEVRLNTDFSG
jgi:hypothetical protein